MEFFNVFLGVFITTPPAVVFIIGVIIFAYFYFSQKKITGKNIINTIIILFLLLLYGILGTYLNFSEYDGYSFSEYLAEQFTFFSLFLMPAVLAFGGVYLFDKKNLLIKITVLLWLLYGLYELILMPTLLCPEGPASCNIRVDLVLIYPVLLVFTISAVARSLLRK